MNATFFPPDVRRALEDLERDLAGYDSPPERLSRLADELRRWERKWRAGEVRLIVQCEEKPNGEGGL